MKMTATAYQRPSRLFDPTAIRMNNEEPVLSSDCVHPSFPFPLFDQSFPFWHTHRRLRRIFPALRLVQPTAHHAVAFFQKCNANRKSSVKLVWSLSQQITANVFPHIMRAQVSTCKHCRAPVARFYVSILIGRKGRMEAFLWYYVQKINIY